MIKSFGKTFCQSIHSFFFLPEVGKRLFFEHSYGRTFCTPTQFSKVFQFSNLQTNSAVTLYFFFSSLPWHGLQFGVQMRKEKNERIISLKLCFAIWVWPKSQTGQSKEKVQVFCFKFLPRSISSWKWNFCVDQKTRATETSTLNQIIFYWHGPIIYINLFWTGRVILYDLLLWNVCYWYKLHA